MKPRQAIKKRKQFGKKRKQLRNQTEIIKQKKDDLKKEKISKERNRSKRNVPVSTTVNLSQSSATQNSKARRLVEKQAFRQNQVYEAQKEIERSKGKGSPTTPQEELHTELGDPVNGDFDKIHQ